MEYLSTARDEGHESELSSLKSDDMEFGVGKWIRILEELDAFKNDHAVAGEIYACESGATPGGPTPCQPILQCYFTLWARLFRPSLSRLSKELRLLLLRASIGLSKLVSDLSACTVQYFHSHAENYWN